MNFDQFNNIGISCQLDWKRIRHLFCIGFFGALLSFVGDILLGWGVEDEALTGLLRMISAYTGTSDTGIFAIALLGLFGITLEGLSYFGVYRLMAESSSKAAHMYRTGIFGYVIFGGCGFHVPVCALVFLTKHGVAAELISEYCIRFIAVPVAMFCLSLAILSATQIKAFVKGLTPYPKWCWIFSLPIGCAAILIVNVFGNQPWVNALNCAWLGFGNLWMFAGLLAMSKKLNVDI